MKWLIVEDTAVDFEGIRQVAIWHGCGDSDRFAIVAICTHERENIQLANFATLPEARIFLKKLVDNLNAEELT